MTATFPPTRRAFEDPESVSEARGSRGYAPPPWSLHRRRSGRGPPPGDTCGSRFRSTGGVSVGRVVNEHVVLTTNSCDFEKNDTDRVTVRDKACVGFVIETYSGGFYFMLSRVLIFGAKAGMFHLTSELYHAIQGASFFV